MSNLYNIVYLNFYDFITIFKIYCLLLPFKETNNILISEYIKQHFQKLNQ